MPNFPMSQIYIYSMYVQNAVRAERLNVER